jgi:hypothetical protein
MSYFAPHYCDEGIRYQGHGNSLETGPSGTTFTLLRTEDTEPDIGRLVDYQEDGEED